VILQIRIWQIAVQVKAVSVSDVLTQHQILIIAVAVRIMEMVKIAKEKEIPVRPVQVHGLAIAIQLMVGKIPDGLAVSILIPTQAIAGVYTMIAWVELVLQALVLANIRIIPVAVTGLV